MRKVSYLHKHMLISSMNIVIIAFILTIVSYYIQGKVILKNIQEQSANYTVLAFDLLDTSDIESINTNHNLSSPQQKRLTSLLSYISNKNPSIGQAYIFSTAIKDNAYTKVLAMPQELIDFENGRLVPGIEYRQPFEIIESIHKLNRTKKIIKTDVYTDIYGTWVTVLLPIMDENNEVYAYFGIDMDASIIKKAQNDLLVISLLITSIILVSVLGIQYVLMNKVLQPVKNLFLAINKASEGVDSLQLEEDYHGDIGELNKKFNNLISFMTLAENYKQLLDENKKQLSFIKKQNKQLISYSKQVEQVTLFEERTRIARELHDTIGHRLTSIIMGLEIIKKTISLNTREAENKLSSLLKLSKDSLEEVRQTARILSTIDMEDNTLTTNCQKIIDEFQVSTDINVVFNVNGHEIVLIDQLRIALIRCLQESLTNSVKHGNCSIIHVSIDFFDSHVSLTVKDNGIGKESIQFGFGLNGMKTRLEAYNGRLEVKKNKDKGFTVSCVVPLQGALGDKKIKVMIVDDQELIRESLSILLEFEKDFIIVDSASDGEEALERCKKEEPNIVLLDIDLPKLNGIDVLKRLKAEMPAVKVIILTTFSSIDYAKEAITNGAEGYLLKSISPIQLANSIRLIYQGGTLLPQNLAHSLAVSTGKSKVAEKQRKLTFNEYGLTKREQEILLYLIDGLTYSDIAEEVGLSKGTVKNYVSSIYSKLYVENRTQAVKKLLDNN